MIRRLGGIVLLPLFSCSPEIVSIPVETEFFLLNFSRRWCATLELRSVAEGGAFSRPLPLIPPGAVFRQRFLELLPETGGCPDRLDMRVHLYKRVDESRPTGCDPVNEAPGPYVAIASDLIEDERRSRPRSDRPPARRR